MQTSERIPTSTFNSYAAALFDFFGSVELALDRNCNFRTLGIRIAGLPKPYLFQLRNGYEGRVHGSAWVIEEGEAEGFINSIRFFVIYRREQLQLFLRARRSLRRELTEKEKQRRLKIVDSLSEEPTGFVLPPSFFKNTIN
jgi:hypothetical protein